MICHGEPLRPALEAWLGGPVPDDTKFIGRMVGGQVVAVAGIGHWCGWDCELSIGSSGGLSRDFIRAVFGYVFNDLNCRRVTGRVDASLDWAARLERLGFVPEGRMRSAAVSGQDTLIFGMLRRECRWLERT